MVFWSQTYKNFGRSDPQWAQARAQYLSRACAGELIRACVRCVLNRLRLGVAWARAFSFLGRLFGLGLLAPGMAGGYIARLEGGRLFLWGWVGVCCLGAWACIALAAGVCVCAYSCRACLVRGICCHREKSPAIPGPDRRAICAAWWSWCRVDRWPGLLPVLAAWCGRSCGRVCAYSPGGDAGGIMAGSLGLLPVVDRLPDALENHGKFTEKFPGKMPTKKFFKKISPYGGTVCTRKFFAKRGLTAALMGAML